jgi:hypothetical protein
MRIKPEDWYWPACAICGSTNLKVEKCGTTCHLGHRVELREIGRALQSWMRALSAGVDLGHVSAAAPAVSVGATTLVPVKTLR